MRNKNGRILRHPPIETSAANADVPSGNKRGNLIDRHLTAKILEMSHSSVRRVEGIDLHPIRDAKGQWWFNEDEVRALALERQRSATNDPTTVCDGQLAAKVFRLLDAGKRIDEIVSLLDIHPTTARALAREWADLKGGFFVPAELLARMNSLPCLLNAEPITNEQELVDALTDAQLDDCRVWKEDGRPAICMR